MNYVKLLLVSSIAMLFAYILMVWFGWDRMIYLHAVPLATLINRYETKPKPSKRTVILLRLDDKDNLSDITLKSLLDQSIGVHQISVETSDGKVRVTDEQRKIVTVHKPGTEKIREQEADTLLFHVINGEIYSYDFIDINVPVNLI